LEVSLQLKCLSSVSCLYVPCRYFLAPKGEIVDGLNEKQISFSTELEKLKKNKGALEKGLKGVEEELRELLQSSPALAQQLMSRER